MADERGGRRRDVAQLFSGGSACPPEEPGTPNPDYSPELFGIEEAGRDSAIEASLRRIGS